MPVRAISFILLYLAMVFTDNLIQELISCPKKITDSPKQAKGWGSQSTKREFWMESEDGLHKFKGYINQNTNFPENFSIGLVYYPRDEKGKVCLLRCNGPHGDHIGAPEHHLKCHIHTVLARDIADGMKRERHVEKDANYAPAIDDAIQYYVKRVNLNVADKRKHFPLPNNQSELDFNNGQE
jgi:hypothetical protein